MILLQRGQIELFTHEYLLMWILPSEKVLSVEVLITSDVSANKSINVLKSSNTLTIR